ncbi:hypothetical protein CGRA01v4_03508 [Colletotrichum graminicola]|nr:hypothetical protein CGRA01v4_03508 [Colletotrichum graminicola]
MLAEQKNLPTSFGLGGTVHYGYRSRHSTNKGHSISLTYQEPRPMQALSSALGKRRCET